MSPATPRTDVDVDPVTLEVIRSSLKHNMDEIELTLCRTAYSSTIYEVRDMCAGWMDVDCNLIAQGRYGLPIFMADLATTVRPGLAIYGRDGWAPGDVVVTNHAATAGQHLNNVVVYSPMFYEDELVGFTATRAHWNDVGGKAVGSLATDSTEIYQEGIQWNTLKIMKGGVQDDEVYRMIAENVRFPDQVIGDMRAQIAACNLGERRFADLIRKYGLDVVRAATYQIWEQSEARARHAVAAIPDGTYRSSAFLDNDGVHLDERLNIECTVVIDGSDMTVDFTGSHPQTGGPMNCGVAGALAAARVAFKCITAPGATPDEGAFRPLHLVVPEGTFLSAVSPAPLGQWVIPLPTVVELVLTALAPAIPDRIPAAHMGDMATCFIYQQSTPDREGFLHADPLPGGWGARPDGDGPVPLKSYCHGDTLKISTELEELKYPFRVNRFELRQDSGGAGRYRGTPGIDREFEMLEDVMVTTSLERSQCPPWGLMGGGPGGTCVATLTTPDGQTEQFQKATMKKLPAGSRLTVCTAGGGGYGPAVEREPERVRDDVARGYVSRGEAEHRYGVVLAESVTGLAVDVDATRTRRTGMAQAAEADEGM